jgi:hypothetical protein
MESVRRRSQSVVWLVVLGACGSAAFGAAVSACNSLSGIDAFEVVSEAGSEDIAADGVGAGAEGSSRTDAATGDDASANGGPDSKLVDEGIPVTGDATGDVATGLGDARSDASRCAIPTPVCPGGCTIAHSNGLSQMFYDCVEAGTYNETQALEACAAFTGDAAACVNNAFPCSQAGQVCSTGFSTCACWKYMGNTDVGRVLNTGTTSCSCVGNNTVPWY